MHSSAIKLYKFVVVVCFYIFFSQLAVAAELKEDTSHFGLKKIEHQLFILDYPPSIFTFSVLTEKIYIRLGEHTDNLLDSVVSYNQVLTDTFSTLLELDKYISTYFNKLYETPDPLLKYTAYSLFEPLLLNYKQLVQQQRIQLEANALERNEIPSHIDAYVSAGELEHLASQYKCTERYLDNSYQQLLQQRDTIFQHLPLTTITVLQKGSFLSEDEDSKFWQKYTIDHGILNEYLISSMNMAKDESHTRFPYFIISNAKYHICTTLYLAEIAARYSEIYLYIAENIPEPLRSQMHDFVKGFYVIFSNTISDRFDLIADIYSDYLTTKSINDKLSLSYITKTLVAYQRANALLRQLLWHVQ